MGLGLLIRPGVHHRAGARSEDHCVVRGTGDRAADFIGVLRRELLVDLTMDSVGTSTMSLPSPRGVGFFNTL